MSCRFTVYYRPLLLSVAAANAEKSFWIPRAASLAGRLMIFETRPVGTPTARAFGLADEQS